MATYKTDQTTLAAVLCTGDPPIFPTDPALLGLRFNSEDLTANATQTLSAELDTSRHPRDSARTALSSGGSVTQEVAYDVGTDLLIEAALGDTWTTNTIVVSNEIKALGIQKTIGTSAPGVGAGYESYEGIFCDGFALTVAPNAINQIAWTFAGGNAPVTTLIPLGGTGSVTVPGAEAVIASTQSTMALTGDLASITGTCITAFGLTLANNVNSLQCIGGVGDKHSGQGQAQIEGTFTIVFTDSTAFDAFLDAGNSFGISCDMQDGNGKGYKFDVQAARLKAAPVPTSGTGETVTYNCAFDGYSGLGLVVTRTP